MFFNVHITYLIIAMVLISDQLVSSAKCKKCKSTTLRKSRKVSKPIHNKVNSRFLTTMRMFTKYDNKVTKSTTVAFQKRILSHLENYGPDIKDMYNNVGRIFANLFNYVVERRKLQGVERSF